MDCWVQKCLFKGISDHYALKNICLLKQTKILQQHNFSWNFRLHWLPFLPTRTQATSSKFFRVETVFCLYGVPGTAPFKFNRKKTI